MIEVAKVLAVMGTASALATVAACQGKGTGNLGNAAVPASVATEWKTRGEGGLWLTWAGRKCQAMSTRSLDRVVGHMHTAGSGRFPHHSCGTSRSMLSGAAKRTPANTSRWSDICRTRAAPAS